MYNQAAIVLRVITFTRGVEVDIKLMGTQCLEVKSCTAGDEIINL